MDDIDPQGKVSLSLVGEPPAPTGSGSSLGELRRRDRGSDRGETRAVGTAVASAASTARRPAAAPVASFEAAFEAELVSELGDLGPAGRVPAAGERGSHRAGGDDRGARGVPPASA